MKRNLQEAYQIAETAEVQTPPDCAVVYSVSYLPDTINREQAQAFVRSHPQCKLLDDTPCGRALIALGLEGKIDQTGAEIAAVWALASKRFIRAAAGNITAFVAGADPRSTFCTIELPEILANPRLLTINHCPKQDFSPMQKPRP